MFREREDIRQAAEGRKQMAESRRQMAEGRRQVAEGSIESGVQYGKLRGKGLPSAACLLPSSALVAALFNFHQTTIERRAAAHVREPIGGERVHVAAIRR